ncbi:MAG: glycoside hydrolase family 13 protein [Clostridia bacterium]|nr:glycoside hydrolase family 13 protein [Clostridia bacterium]
MRILYNSKDLRYKRPFGTLTPSSACEIFIEIPVSIRTCKVSLVLMRESGEEYASFRMEKISCAGDYERYGTVFSIPREGLYFYCFRITTEKEAFTLYRQGFDQTNMEAGELWQLSCIPPGFAPPEEYAGSVMYQIFPDRFHRKGTCSVKGKLEPFWMHRELSEVPCHKPDEKGEVCNCDFYGGNLAGIEEKLDYLKKLGVKVIYLNPIFKAWSNHRYDTADYKVIDELLGTERDFSRLCKSAHKRGMKIILDGVFSHTGSNSRYFDEKDLFGSGAYHHPDSPYRSWFDFQDYPHTYTSWWGIKTLPCVREMDEGFLDYIIDGEDSVVAHWIKAGADGFRLDVADELPDAFILRLRRRLKELKPDALLIGEVWEDASNKCSYGQRRRYFTDGELDSVMNYPFRTAILNFVTGHDTGEGFRNTVMDLAENYPPRVVLNLMNMLSTHDTPRILSALSPAPVPENKDDRAGFMMSESDLEIATQRLTCALALQFALPGMPCIYYGDELGTQGLEDPFCRGYFDWSRTDMNPIFELVSAFASVRNRESALRFGTISVFCPAPSVLVLERSLEALRIRTTVNVSDTAYICEREGELLLSEKIEINDETFCIKPFGFVMEKS